MGRLIDADSVGLTDFEIVMCDGDYKKAFKLLCEKLDNAPTVDAVEIIRCRECIHLQKSGQCDKTHLWIGTKEGGGCDDFFCGDGKRKDDESVIHGHWEDCSNGWMCSVCNRDSSRGTEYCPHCGAKMDGEPVEHAHWIELYKGNYKCSSCGAWWSATDNEAINDLNYCPTCGVKMDEVTE